MAMEIGEVTVPEFPDPLACGSVVGQQVTDDSGDNNGQQGGQYGLG